MSAASAGRDGSPRHEGDFLVFVGEIPRDAKAKGNGQFPFYFRNL